MRTPILALCLAFALPALASSVYRWVDEAGHVHYSDQPPPTNIKKATQKNYTGSVIGSGESYDMRQAKEKYPVTLFTSGCGPACDMGKQLLDKRGIPYSLKDLENNVENQKALRDLTGNLRIPTLVVGSQKMAGFEDGQWNRMLDTAGYPKASSNSTAPQPAAGSNPQTTAAPPAGTSNQ